MSECIGNILESDPGPGPGPVLGNLAFSKLPKSDIMP